MPLNRRRQRAQMIAASVQDQASQKPQYRIASHAARWQQIAGRCDRDPAELCSAAGPRPKPSSALRIAATRVSAARARGHSSRRCVAAIRAIRCCCRCCRSLPRCAVSTGFALDPVGDMASRAAQGVLHKYEGRALLVATGACAVHCRYCFRRHFPYQRRVCPGARLGRAAIELLRSDASRSSEVILSGGDPLSLSDRRLQATDGRNRSDAPHASPAHSHALSARAARAHRRGLLDWLADVPLQKVIVIHANHANEIDADSRGAPVAN